MIMKISNFNSNITIGDEYIRVLEIEDKALFSNIIHSVFSLCNMEESIEYIILEDEGKDISFNKDVYFLIDILNVDLNDRKILNKLYSKIKLATNLDAEIRWGLEEHYREAFNLLNTILLDFPFDFEYKIELDIEDLIKLYGIRLYNKGQALIEKILYLIDLISLLDLCKVLIFCNLKSFFTDAQLVEIYKHIINNKLNVLLIEGSSSEKLLDYERKIRIDKDFEDYEL